MSETTKLNKVLKASTEVTSLDSTDRVLAVDSDGNPLSIAADTFLTQNTVVGLNIPANQEGWLRIAKLGNYGAACIIGVTMIGFNGGWNLPVLLAVSAPHGSSKTTMDITPLNKKQTETSNGKYAFSKIRITGNEMNKYLDIYVVAKNVTRSLRVSLGASLDCSLMTPSFDPQESAYTKEFLISDLWGGVNHYSTISYELSSQTGRKGGRHEHGYNNVVFPKDNRSAERSLHFVCDDVVFRVDSPVLGFGVYPTWRDCGLRRGYEFRSVLPKQGLQKLPCGIGEHVGYNSLHRTVGNIRKAVVHTSVEQWRDILQDSSVGSLVRLGGNYTEAYYVIGKEVAA